MFSRTLYFTKLDKTQVRQSTKLYIIFNIVTYFSIIKVCIIFPIGCEQFRIGHGCSDSHTEEVLSGLSTASF